MTQAQRLAELARIAEELARAEREVARIELVTTRIPDLTRDESYAIAQSVSQGRGRRTGYKLGYTSEAMRRQMNIEQPNYGILTEDMMVGPGLNEIDAGRFFHPRVEPELSLQLGADLRADHPGAEEVAAAIVKVYPSIEIVDTRYHDYRFTALDNIADNSSSARCVLGTALPYDRGLDLKSCRVELLADGKPLAGGQGSDALGDPLLAVAWLAEALAARGEFLRAGDLVMTGGLTCAYPIAAGELFCARFAGIGSVELRLLAPGSVSM